MNEFLEVLQQGYMQRAIVAGLLVGVTCPAIGLYLVLRRYSLLGDGLGHMSFAGVGFGWWAGIYPLLGAGVFAVLGALGVEWLRSRQRGYGDLALAMIFYFGIALGVVLASLSRNLNVNLLGYLFGSILTVTELDLVLMAVACVAVLGTLALLGKEFFALTYDEEVARVSGLPVGALNTLIVVLAAVTVVAALRVVGILLVAGLLVIPVASSLQLARSFRGAIAYAIVVGLVSVLAGLVGAYFLDLPAGGAIVLAAILAYVATAFGRRLAGRPGRSPVASHA